MHQSRVNNTYSEKEVRLAERCGWCSFSCKANSPLIHFRSGKVYTCVCCVSYLQRCNVDLKNESFSLSHLHSLNLDRKIFTKNKNNVRSEIVMTGAEL